MSGEQRPSTNITAEHKEQFTALTSGEYLNFALFSCYVDGEPTAAIVEIDRDGEQYVSHPLFVAITPGMVLTDHEGKEPRWGVNMDPNAALEEIREIVMRADEEDTDVVEDYNRLVDLIAGLDLWMSHKGFPPKDWERQDHQD